MDKRVSTLDYYIYHTSEAAGSSAARRSARRSGRPTPTGSPSTLPSQRQGSPVRHRVRGTRRYSPNSRGAEGPAAPAHSLRRSREALRRHGHSGALRGRGRARGNVGQPLSSSRSGPRAPPEFRGRGRCRGQLHRRPEGHRLDQGRRRPSASSWRHRDLRVRRAPWLRRRTLGRRARQRPSGPGRRLRRAGPGRLGRHHPGQPAVGPRPDRPARPAAQRPSTATRRPV